MSIETCAPGGRMLCLHGSRCNLTTGGCDECPSGFINDNAIFLGNRDCGMPIAYMGFVYIFSSLFALYTAQLAIRIARAKTRKSNVRKVLLWIAAWNMIIPIYCLSHYLSGYQNGASTIVLYELILMMVNCQVVVLGFTLWKYMAILCGVWSQEYIYKASKYWFIFWMSMKVSTGVAMFVSVLRYDYVSFNYTQMVLAVSLYIETGCNVYKGHSNSVKMINALSQLRSDAKVTTLSDVVVEFVDRVKKTKNIQPFFGVFFVLVVTALTTLFAIFGSSVPYQFLLWSIPLLLWPLLGLAPVLRARGKFAEHLDRQDDNSSDSTRRAQNYAVVAENESIIVPHAPLFTSLETKT